MQRVLIATFLAALAVSAWDHVFWSSRLLDGLHAEPSDEGEIMEVLEENLDGTGEYVVGEDPTPCEAATGEHTYAEISFTEDGPSWNRPDTAGRMMAVGFATFLPAALLLFILGPRLRRFSTRFLVVAMLGAAAGIWSNGSYVLVDGGTWKIGLAWLFHHTASWCIAGGILAGIVRPESDGDAEAQDPPRT